MNNTTTQPDNEILELARVTCEELDPSYEAWLDEQREPQDGDDMTEYDDDQQEDDSDDDKYGFMREPREDNFRDDVDADANALAGAGYGTDEDYGCYGGDEW
jgi:Ni,Fe-hydrogenase I large subunit